MILSLVTKRELALKARSESTLVGFRLQRDVNNASRTGERILEASNAAVAQFIITVGSIEGLFHLLKYVKNERQMGKLSLVCRFMENTRLSR